MFNEKYGEKTDIAMCNPIGRSITSDLQNISYALSEIENIADLMLRKIDGGSDVCNGNSEKEPVCISEILEKMKTKSERIAHRLDQVNNFI